MLEELGLNDKIEVEWLIFADKATAIQGKMYALGAGWSTYNTTKLPSDRHSFSIATSVLVPWNHTNESHVLHLNLVDQDGNSEIEIEGQFEVGRAPGVRPGTPQRIVLAFDVDIQYKKLNTFVLKSSIDGVPSREVQYRVLAVPGSSADSANASAAS